MSYDNVVHHVSSERISLLKRIIKTSYPCRRKFRHWEDPVNNLDFDNLSDYMKSPDPSQILTPQGTDYKKNQKENEEEKGTTKNKNICLTWVTLSTYSKRKSTTLNLSCDQCYKNKAAARLSKSPIVWAADSSRGVQEWHWASWGPMCRGLARRADHQLHVTGDSSLPGVCHVGLTLSCFIKWLWVWTKPGKCIVVLHLLSGKNYNLLSHISPTHTLACIGAHTHTHIYTINTDRHINKSTKTHKHAEALKYKQAYTHDSVCILYWHIGEMDVDSRLS